MIAIYLLIGLGAGLSSGVFGIGGGVVIVPALTLLAGFTQEKAIGTSLAVLLPPVGLWAALEYYRNGDVEVKGAFLMALGLFIGAWLGALGAHKMGEAWLKVAFGFFLIALGLYTVASSLKGVSVKGL